jgi:iron complex outermembrane receptor protein
MDMPGFSRTFGAFAEASYKISAKQGLKLRSDFSATDLTASMTMYQQGSPPMYMLTWPDHRKTQSGISAAWRNRPDSAWKIEVNARADWIRHRLTTDAAKEEIEILGYPTAGRDDFGKNLSASVNKMISGHASLSFSMAYSERIPSSSELYGFYLFNAQDGYDYIGKADLKPEQAVQAELSSGIHSHRFQIRLTAYAVLLNNYITGIVQPGFIPMTSGANGVKSYLNLPFAQLLGGEGSINWQPVKTVQAIGTLKYTYASDDHQMPLPFIAPLKSVISLRWQPGAFSAQAECEASAAQNRFSISAGEDGTPGYMLLHLRLGYSLPIRSTMIGVQAGIENVFDRYYHDHLDWNNIPRPGRNIYLQASIGF